MDSLTFWAKTKEQDELFLGAPSQAVLKKDRGAADMLTVKFISDSPWENLRTISGFTGGELFFYGIVDEQITRLDKFGMTTTLVARSISGVLMDNEVAPTTFRDPSLRFIEAKFLVPLGFSVAKGDMKSKKGELTVKKGTSVMTLLKDFCSKYFGTDPVFDYDGKVYCDGSVPKKSFVIRDVLSREISEENYKVISEYWGRNTVSGGYTAKFTNPNAMGISRKRYINTCEKIDFSTKIKVRIKAIGFINASIGDDIITDFCPRGQMLSMKYTLDDEGETTEIAFEYRDNV